MVLCFRPGRPGRFFEGQPDPFRPKLHGFLSALTAPFYKSRRRGGMRTMKRRFELARRSPVPLTAVSAVFVVISFASAFALAQTPEPSPTPVPPPQAIL